MPGSGSERGVRPLGAKQRDMLRILANPSNALVVSDTVSASLVRRGLLAAEPDGSWAHITPAGLRAIADEIDAGRIAMFSVERMRAAPPHAATPG